MQFAAWWIFLELFFQVFSTALCAQLAWSDSKVFILPDQYNIVSWMLTHWCVLLHLTKTINHHVSFCLTNIPPPPWKKIIIQDTIHYSKITTEFNLHSLLFINPLTPMSDQDRISPYIIIAKWSRIVIRIKKNINWGIISWFNTNSPN